MGRWGRHHRLPAGILVYRGGMSEGGEAGSGQCWGPSLQQKIVDTDAYVNMFNTKRHGAA